MMAKAKGVTVGISTIYYWIHHGKLGLNKQNLLYPRKGKTVKKQASPNFKPAGQSIEQRPEAINLRLENGHYEIDTGSTYESEKLLFVRFDGSKE